MHNVRNLENFGQGFLAGCLFRPGVVLDFRTAIADESYAWCLRARCSILRAAFGARAFELGGPMTTEG